MNPFTCPRCGMTSHSPADIADGYCGHCHARTGTAAELTAAMEYYTGIPVAMAPPRQLHEELTPEVLLRHPAWRLADVTAETATFTWVPSGGGPVNWTLTRLLGVVYASWARSELTVQVHTQIFGPLLDGPASQPLEARVCLAGMRRLPGTDVPDSGWYCCPACARQFQVPPGHRAPVLCGCTVPPPVMLNRSELALAEYARAQESTARYLRLRQAGLSSYAARQLAEAAQDPGVQLSAVAEYFASRQEAISADVDGFVHVGPWGRAADASGYARGGPQHDVLADVREARGLVEAYQAQAAWSFEDVGCDMDRMITALCGVPPVSLDEMRGQIARELGMPPHPEEHGQVLPEASYIPDRCPPRRALPGTEHPAEHGEDPGTAARTLLSDYDDPERVFL